MTNDDAIHTMMSDSLRDVFDENAEQPNMLVEQLAQMSVYVVVHCDGNTEMFSGVLRSYLREKYTELEIKVELTTGLSIIVDDDFRFIKSFDVLHNEKVMNFDGPFRVIGVCMQEIDVNAQTCVLMLKC